MKYGFGMFTAEGEKRVLEICATSRTYKQAIRKLRKLWEDERFRECLDTEPRAAVEEWFETLHKN